MKLGWLLSIHHASPRRPVELWCPECSQTAPCNTVETALADSLRQAVRLHVQDVDNHSKCRECGRMWPCRTINTWIKGEERAV